MRDIDGRLWSLQTIAPDGGKLFLRGGKTKGMHHLIGGPVRNWVYVCEGYGIGATSYCKREVGAGWRTVERVLKQYAQPPIKLWRRYRGTKRNTMLHELIDEY
jgi:hypothetical protein